MLSLQRSFYGANLDADQKKLLSCLFSKAKASLHQICQSKNRTKILKSEISFSGKYLYFGQTDDVQVNDTVTLISPAVEGRSEGV